MTADLRDQLGAFDAAARRLLAHPRPASIRLTDRTGLAVALWRLRQQTGQSLAGLGYRVGISRAGIHKRETDGRLPASALIQHARVLGYDLALVPIEPDRRTA